MALLSSSLSASWTSDTILVSNAAPLYWLPLSMFDPWQHQIKGLGARDWKGLSLAQSLESQNRQHWTGWTNILVWYTATSCVSKKDPQHIMNLQNLLPQDVVLTKDLHGLKRGLQVDFEPLPCHSREAKPRAKSVLLGSVINECFVSYFPAM